MGWRYGGGAGKGCGVDWCFVLGGMRVMWSV